MNEDNSKNFFIETYGCQMNLSDSNTVRTLLKENGFYETKSFNEANIILINTCSVRGSAEQRIFGRLSFYKKIKEKQNITLLLIGCMAIDEGLIKKYPFIDYIVGTYHINKLPEIINSLQEEKKVYNNFNKFIFSESYQDNKEPFKAFLPIIHGCNNYCSYCIVPFTRGRETSRKSDEIISNAEKLVDKGVLEITLLGQNVNSYGKDISDINFGQLLEKISNISGLKRLRFITSHPKDFTSELINQIADSEKICNHIHLPLQSASDKILKLMNRHYTINEYRQKIDYLRKKIKKPSITTDLLVGFPSETKNEYLETIKHVKDIQFDEAFMYKYNPRPLTKALEINEEITEQEKNERLQNLIDIQNSITKQINKTYIGTKDEILIENVSKKNKEELFGRTKRNKNVILRGSEKEIASFKTVILNSLNGNTFMGKEL